MTALVTNTLLIKILIVTAGSYLANYLIFCSTDYLTQDLYSTNEEKENYKKFVRSSWALGFVERLLYVLSLIRMQPEFIVFWVGLKVVGGWSPWITGEKSSQQENGNSEEKKLSKARAKFNVTLLRNALSILASFILYSIINNIK